MSGSSSEGEVISHISSYKRWSYRAMTGRQTEFESVETCDCSSIFPSSESIVLPQDEPP